MKLENFMKQEFAFAGLSYYEAKPKWKTLLLKLSAYSFNEPNYDKVS